MLLKLILNECFTKSSSDNSQIHKGISCDFCQGSIAGDRYLCCVCDEYDLCSECFCSECANKTHKLSHPVLRMIRPNTEDKPEDVRKACGLKSLSITFKTVIHSDVNCDNCGLEIMGIRLKCDKCCNFDLCYCCWNDIGHGDGHPMIVYTEDVVQKIQFENITLGKHLGSGAFGSVFKATIQPYNNTVACKIIKNTTDGLTLMKAIHLSACIKSFGTEMYAHNEIRSAFICRMFGYSTTQEEQQFQFYLIMEYMENGSLQDVINNCNIPFLRKVRMLGDIATGLFDMHRKNYVHCDIKADNILVTKDFVAKISDLGVAKNINKKTTDWCAPKNLMPPEYGKETAINYSVDIYMFGLLMFHFMTNEKHEWSDKDTPEATLNNLDKVELPFVRQLIVQSTRINPALRECASYYKNCLRGFVEQTMEMIKNAGQEYGNLETSDKNKLVLALHDDALRAAATKNDIKGLLWDMEIAPKPLASSNINETINKIFLEKSPSVGIIVSLNTATSKGNNSNVKSIMLSTKLKCADTEIEDDIFATTIDFMPSLAETNSQCDNKSKSEDSSNFSHKRQTSTNTSTVSTISSTFSTLQTASVKATTVATKNHPLANTETSKALDNCSPTLNTARNTSSNLAKSNTSNRNSVVMKKSGDGCVIS